MPSRMAWLIASLTSASRRSTRNEPTSAHATAVTTAISWISIWPLVTGALLRRPASVSSQPSPSRRTRPRRSSSSSVRRGSPCPIADSVAVVRVLAAVLPLEHDEVGQHRRDAQLPSRRAASAPPATRARGAAPGTARRRPPPSRRARSSGRSAAAPPRWRARRRRPRRGPERRRQHDHDAQAVGPLPGRRRRGHHHRAHQHHADRLQPDHDRDHEQAGEQDVDPAHGHAERLAPKSGSKASSLNSFQKSSIATSATPPSTAIVITSPRRSVAAWPKRNRSSPACEASGRLLDVGQQHEPEAEEDGQHDAERGVVLDPRRPHDGPDGKRAEQPGDRGARDERRAAPCCRSAGRRARCRAGRRARWRRPSRLWRRSTAKVPSAPLMMPSAAEPRATVRSV